MNDSFYTYFKIQLYDGGVYPCSLSVNMVNCATCVFMSPPRMCIYESAENTYELRNILGGLINTYVYPCSRGVYDTGRH